MDADTLHAIVPSASLGRCRSLIAGYNRCAATVGATTVRRAAVLIAMVAEESASLHATEEYASGAEYEWRADLGNTHPGDGVRFKGRTLIQITGRSNYAGVSRWAHTHWPDVPTSTYFLDHPERLADLEYAWLGPTQYWLHDHDHGYGLINRAADAGDLQAATRMVNGGLNGYDTRLYYYRRALAHGTAILPTPAPAPFPIGVLDMRIVQVSRADCARHHVRWPGWFVLVPRGTAAALEHITSPTRLHALGKRIPRGADLTVAEYRSLGGK